MKEGIGDLNFERILKWSKACKYSHGGTSIALYVLNHCSKFNLSLYFLTKYGTLNYFYQVISFFLILLVIPSIILIELKKNDLIAAPF